jgi:predicted acylesterase/phospholipase RssA
MASFDRASSELISPAPASLPPHVMVLPRLRDMGLMEFDQAKEAIAEGRICVERALPMLRRYL